eukprot:GDKJ01021582.1.p1 GENE.GDKJ01021582.1~~GDKJ01021582.1.p1  ORF type:complete len:901 (+),score=144.01 GDKJ01021582.1:246-2705(+)
MKIRTPFTTSKIKIREEKKTKRIGCRCSHLREYVPRIDLKEILKIEEVYEFKKESMFLLDGVLVRKLPTISLYSTEVLEYFLQNVFSGEYAASIVDSMQLVDAGSEAQSDFVKEIRPFKYRRRVYDIRHSAWITSWTPSDIAIASFIPDSVDVSSVKLSSATVPILSISAIQEKGSLRLDIFRHSDTSGNSLKCLVTFKPLVSAHRAHPFFCLNEEFQKSLFESLENSRSNEFDLKTMLSSISTLPLDAPFLQLSNYNANFFYGYSLNTSNLFFSKNPFDTSLCPTSFHFVDRSAVDFIKKSCNSFFHVPLMFEYVSQVAYGPQYLSVMLSNSHHVVTSTNDALFLPPPAAFFHHTVTIDKKPKPLFEMKSTAHFSRQVVVFKETLTRVSSSIFSSQLDSLQYSVECSSYDERTQKTTTIKRSLFPSRPSPVLPVLSQLVTDATISFILPSPKALWTISVPELVASLDWARITLPPEIYLTQVGIPLSRRADVTSHFKISWLVTYNEEFLVLERPEQFPAVQFTNMHMIDVVRTSDSHLILNYRVNNTQIIFQGSRHVAGLPPLTLSDLIRMPSISQVDRYVSYASYKSLSNSVVAFNRALFVENRFAEEITGIGSYANIRVNTSPPLVSYANLLSRNQIPPVTDVFMYIPPSMRIFEEVEFRTANFLKLQISQGITVLIVIAMLRYCFLKLTQDSTAEGLTYFILTRDMKKRLFPEKKEHEKVPKIEEKSETSKGNARIKSFSSYIFFDKFGRKASSLHDPADEPLVDDSSEFLDKHGFDCVEAERLLMINNVTEKSIQMLRKRKKTSILEEDNEDYS